MISGSWKMQWKHGDSATVTCAVRDLKTAFRCLRKTRKSDD